MNQTNRILQAMLVGALVFGASSAAFSQGANDAAYQLEMQYVQGLDQLGLAEYAQMVLADVQRKFGGGGAGMKAMQMKQILAQGKFEEARQIIAAEPDQNSQEAWEMKLAMGDYLYAFGRYDEGLSLYKQYVNAFNGKVPAPMKEMYLEATYKYGQMLMTLGRNKDAIEAYRVLVKQDIEREMKRQFQFELAELMVKAGAEQGPAGSYLTEAEKICDDLLWDMDLWFGRAIVQKAHILLIRGKPEAANKLVDSYMPQLIQLDEGLIAAGREQGEDFSRLSPIAECRYLRGVMFLKEAEKLLEKDPLSEADKIQARTYLVGDGKGGTGAYQDFIQVVFKYPSTSWAPQADSYATEIEDMLMRNGLVKQIKANVTDAQRREVAKRQFETARVFFNQHQFQEAINIYHQVLAAYPEIVPDSINAMGELAKCYIEMWDPNDPDTEVNELYADAVVGQLSERFCHKDKAAISRAGDQIRAIADVYGERKQEDKRQATYALFFRDFPTHPTAASMMNFFANTAYEAKDFQKALDYYFSLANEYTNSVKISMGAISRIISIYGEQGDKTNQLAWIDTYVDRLSSRKKPGQEMVTMNFLRANIKREEAQELIRAGDTKEGNKALAEAIKMYAGIVKMVEDPDQTKYASSDKDRENNRKFRDGSNYSQAYCYSLLRTKDEDKAKKFKERAIEAYEKLLKDSPKTEYAPAALAQIGTLYVAVGDNEKADKAFTELADKHPDSKEAKMALFTRGMTLIQLGYRPQGVACLKEMFGQKDKYPPQQMFGAAEELYKNKEYELALEGYDAAVERAGEDRNTLMRATLGRAKALSALGKNKEASEILEKFIADYPKSMLMIDANLLLGRAACDAAVAIDDANGRRRMFNKANDALLLVRRLRTTPGEIAATDIDLANVFIKKAEAEKIREGRDPEAKERRVTYINNAVSFLMTVLDSRDPSDPTVAPHLELAYKMCIELLVQSDDPDDANDAIHYADQYLQVFPSGRYATAIRTQRNLASMNATRKDGDGASAPAGEPAPVVEDDSGEEAAEEGDAEESEEAGEAEPAEDESEGEEAEAEGSAAEAAE